MTAWIDGRLVPMADAKVSVLDHGLVVGDGVFETLRVYRGVPFAWTRHLARLRASAEGLGLELPGVTALREAADAVLRANELTEARLRITVTGGVAPPGSGRGDGPAGAFVLAFPIEPAEPNVDVVIAPWTRNEHGALVGLKTISYAANVRALAYAREKGAGEAVFANTKGDLCEATGSNVFLVRDGALTTPPPSAGCLSGVTRALLLELSTQMGIPTEEHDVPVGALVQSDEAFLSSTTREVQPIAAVDGTRLRSVGGPVSERLGAAFRDLVGRDLDP
jgi:branched-chain amino acid aminotransferase